MFSPVSLLAAVALIVVIIAETGRLPVDNPSTHLELTMVHEAMILEYSGPDLAMVELASSMRLTVFLGSAGQPVRAVGDRHHRSAPAGRRRGARLRRQGRPARRRCWRSVEVFLAKLRLFRVPELLAGSFVLGLLAVGASFFLA